MEQRVREFVDGPGRGVITTAELTRLGCGPQVLRTLVRRQVLVRVARGAHVSAARLHPLDEPDASGAASRARAAERAHLLRLDAVLRSDAPRVAASHHSAALAWGLPVLRHDLHRQHVTHTAPGRTARRHDAFTVHRCDLDAVLAQHGGRRLVVPAVAAIGTALTSGLTAGVAAMDAALRECLTTPDDLVERLDQMRHTPGLTTARAALGLADGLAESVGETRLRLLLVRLGVRFVAQHWVRTATGHAIRVDFYLPGLGVVLEFDGEVKAAEVRAVVAAAAQQASPGARGRAAEPPAWAAASSRR